MLCLVLTQTYCSITDSAGLFINWLNNVVAERAYSRKLEMEADSVGLNVSILYCAPNSLVLMDVTHSSWPRRGTTLVRLWIYGI
jgi:hypothetical protein